MLEEYFWHLSGSDSHLNTPRPTQDLHRSSTVTAPEKVLKKLHYQNFLLSRKSVPPRNQLIKLTRGVRVGPSTGIGIASRGL